MYVCDAITHRTEISSYQVSEYFFIESLLAVTAESDN